MANAAQTKDNSNPVNPETKKYMRFQEAGLSHWLAIPPGLILAEMFGIGCYAQVAILLALIGWVWFCIGLIGRQNLATKQKEEPGPADCSK